MNNENSDEDIFECYIAPSSDFLIGKQHKRSQFTQTCNVDQTSVEVGQVVNQILKNNFNYVIAVLSPMVMIESEEYRKLKILTRLNLSKLCYHSIHGLATHNYNKYIIDKGGDTQKRRKTIMRTLRFGINLLENGRTEFNPVTDYISDDDIISMIERLDQAYEYSNLPEKPEYQEVMYLWLLNLRIRELNNENLIMRN